MSIIWLQLGGTSAFWSILFSLSHLLQELAFQLDFGSGFFHDNHCEILAQARIQLVATVSAYLCKNHILLVRKLLLIRKQLSVLISLSL